MKKKVISRIVYAITIPFVLFFVVQNFSPDIFSRIIFQQSNALTATTITSKTFANEKQKGVHLFGSIDSTDITALHENNIEWVTIVTWGYQEDINTSNITHFNTHDSIQVEKRLTRLTNKIKMVQDAGFKVFFKPHLWINNPDHRDRRSDIYPTGKKGWQEWSESYRRFIMDCARIAEENKVDLFCIGTELTKISKSKAMFWKDLIQEVRTVYSGQITYAANWYKEFEDIQFWKELDYIGVQAYFPLVEKPHPTVQEIAKGWSKHLDKLESLSIENDRSILFTELGYKSTYDSAIEPWKWTEDTSVGRQLYSPETQANCYEAFFSTVWLKKWFAGVHIWQWRTNSRFDPTRKSLGFSPQGNPAEKILTTAFKD